MNTDHAINTLNSLIATTLDSADGYAEAAKDADGEPLVTVFRARSHERRNVASTLQQAVRHLGGKPEDEGTVLASAHRMFLNLRTHVTSNENKAMVDEVERGEDHIKGKFEDGMKDDDLSLTTKTDINAAYASVRKGHDEMRDLKNAFEQ